jgi:hypothetical protein
VIIPGGAGDCCAFFEREFDSVLGGEAVFAGVAGNGDIIDIAGSEIFPPNLLSALAEVPGNDAGSELGENVHRHQAATVEPMNVVAEIDQADRAMSEVEVEFAGAILQLRGVVMDAEADAHREEASAKLCEGRNLGMKFLIRFLTSDGVRIAVEDGEPCFAAVAGSGENAIDGLGGGGWVMERATGVEADGAQSMFEQACGEVGVHFRVGHIEETLGVIVAAILDGVQDFVEVLVEVAAGTMVVLGPAVELGADGGAGWWGSHCAAGGESQRGCAGCQKLASCEAKVARGGRERGRNPHGVREG